MVFPVIFLVGLSFYIIFSTYFVEVNKQNIRANVSSNFSFVHISDIHGTVNFLNGRLSNIINNIRPDFVVVTGDLSNNIKQLPKVLKELEKIKVEKGIIVVPGNYEYEGPIGLRKRSLDTEWVEQLFKNTQKTILLKNQHHAFNIKNNDVLIYGFDNGTYGNEDYCFDIDNIKHDFKIILAHSPNIIRYIEKNNIKFNQLLAGHTHGGQIRIFNNMHLKEYKDFHVGVKCYRDSLFCISRGLGTVKLPFRFNCFPEISLYNVMPMELKV